MHRTLYKNYLLGVLMAILAFSFVDRFAIGILLQDIKRDLDLSDTQLGLITGIAFAVLYSLMGLPLARCADRGNRVRMISVILITWSVMVALTGAVTTFFQLLLVRIGVGIGEAGCVPASNSLIADYFARRERPRAAAIYWLGTSLGIALGYLSAWLEPLYGWRTTFVILSCPGFALAALVLFTLREPRAKARSHDLADANTERFVDTIRILWRSRTYRHLLYCMSVIYFCQYGTLQWQPSYFIRTYHIPVAEVGTWFAIVSGSTGALGTYLGGEWASRFAGDDESAQLRFGMLTYGALALIAPFTYITHNYFAAMLLLGIVSLGASLISGPMIGTIQSLVREDMRAVSIAIIFLFSNLVGMGLGPLATGVMSDLLHAWLGDESLRYALIAMSPCFLWAALHFWRASRTVAQDLQISK